MKTPMRLLAAIYLALALTGSARPALAQDEPPPPPPSDQGDADSPAPADEEDDDVFIPTEEIPADEEITFPVNI